MRVAVVIPAKSSNKYHPKGDFAPFGDTTLIEWKLSQCLEVFDKSDIYVVTDKSNLLNSEVNIIRRNSEDLYSNMVVNTVDKIDSEIIMWVNPTSPFISGIKYKEILEKYFEKIEEFDSLATTYIKNDFVYFDNKKLNFDKHSDGREVVTPIYILTNGVYINKKSNILKNRELITENIYLFKLQFLESLELKDTYTYTIFKELIYLYFKKELNVE